MLKESTILIYLRAAHSLFGFPVTPSNHGFKKYLKLNLDCYSFQFNSIQFWSTFISYPSSQERTKYYIDKQNTKHRGLSKIYRVRVVNAFFCQSHHFKELLELSKEHLNWPSGPMLSISRFVRLSVHLSVRLSVRVFAFEVPFIRLFTPTS